MKDKDILDDFLESSNPEQEKKPLLINVSEDGMTITLFTNRANIKKLTEEEEDKARAFALEKLDTIREAFLNFVDLTNANNTFSILSAAITSFAEFANGITFFIANPKMTEEEYEETELADYIMYETAAILAEEYVYECYEELDDHEKNG